MNSIKINGKTGNINKILLSLFLKGVSIVKPNKILKDYVKVKNKDLIISDNKRNVSYKNPKKIFPICIGKASTETAESLNNIFENKKIKLSKGIVVVNQENYKKIKNFKSFISSHPLPNQKGIEASKSIIEYLKKTDENDLILVFISGGGSSLLPLPSDGLSLKNKIDINKKLLESGANIDEINCVRKHLSKIKGGNFLKFCYPSKVHSLILSDVVGDDLSSISSGLTVPDPSTFVDAKNILIKYGLWKKIPKKISNHLLGGINSDKLETPKTGNKIFEKSKNTLIGSNFKSLDEIKRRCIDKKLMAKIWKKNIEGDVKNVAFNFIKDLKILKYKVPIVLISGGETTVKISGDGLGGRNQEFALHFINFAYQYLPSLKFALLSAGTDGRDGPTDAAGAIVNHNSFNEIKKKGVNLNEELLNNNSYNVLKLINSLVIINGTNTNVADIQLLTILG